MLSYIDRPLFQLAVIVVFGLVVGFVVRQPSHRLAKRIVAGGFVCVAAGFVAFLVQLGSLYEAFQAVSLRPLRDEFGMGRLVTIGYALMFCGVVVLFRRVSQGSESNLSEKQ